MEIRQDLVQRTIKVLENEKACVIRNIRQECDRDCGKCDLVLPDREIINAYNYALDILNMIGAEQDAGQTDNNAQT